MSDDVMTDVVWRGPEQLRPLLVPADTLTPDPDNANTHPEKNLRAIRSSLGQYGQQKPIVVSPEGVIAAGNATWTVIREGGIPQPEGGDVEKWTHVAAIVSDLTPEQLVGYGIVDNRSGELAEWDLSILADRLGALSIEEVEALGFDEADLLKLLGADDGELDPEAEWQGMPDFEQDDKQSVYRVTVHFTSHEDVDAFFDLIDRPRKSYMWWPQDDGHVGSSLHEEYVAEDA